MTDASGGNAGSRPSADDLDGEQDGPPPPERPALTDQRRPPVRKSVPPPWPLPTARVLWFVSFAASAAAILIAFLSHEAIAVELEETLLRVAPNYDATSIGSLVDVIYWSTIAALGVVVTAEAVLLAVLLNRRGGARWLQVPVLALHGVAAVAGIAFLAVVEFGVIVEVLIIAGLLFAVLGWFFPFLPSAHRWFRTKHQSQAAARG